MGTILAITTNTSCSIKLIKCETTEDAIYRMKNTYEKLCKEHSYDYHNTFIDEEEGYAQVVYGLEQTELRIGSLSSANGRNNYK